MPFLQGSDALCPRQGGNLQIIIIRSGTGQLRWICHDCHISCWIELWGVFVLLLVLQIVMSIIWKLQRILVTNAKVFLCPFFQGESEVTSTRLTPRDSAAAPVVPAKHLSTATIEVCEEMAKPSSFHHLLHICGPQKEKATQMDENLWIGPGRQRKQNLH